MLTAFHYRAWTVVNGDFTAIIPNEALAASVYSPAQSFPNAAAFVAFLRETKPELRTALIRVRTIPTGLVVKVSEPPASGCGWTMHYPAEQAVAA